MRIFPTFAPQTRRGFTLVELLGVVVIVLIFSMLLLTSNRNATQSAQDITVQQQQAQLQSAVEAWIAQQASIHAAITAWRSSATTTSAMLNWSGGPIALLSQSSRLAFSNVGSNIGTAASLARGKAFQVSWGTGDTNSMLQQGPVVSIVSVN